MIPSTMKKTQDARISLAEQGFAIINGVFSRDEIDFLLAVISDQKATNANFRSGAELFAIRQFLKEVPDVVPHLFTQPFCRLLAMLSGGGYFVVKSIYFDKPGASNWFVPYHQDLTISV